MRLPTTWMDTNSGFREIFLCTIDLMEQQRLKLLQLPIRMSYLLLVEISLFMTDPTELLKLKLLPLLTKTSFLRRMKIRSTKRVSQLLKKLPIVLRFTRMKTKYTRKELKLPVKQHTELNWPSRAIFTIFMQGE